MSPRDPNDWNITKPRPGTWFNLEQEHRTTWTRDMAQAGPATHCSAWARNMALPGPETWRSLDQGWCSTWTKDVAQPGPGTGLSMDEGNTMDPGPWARDLGPQTVGQGPWNQDCGPTAARDRWPGILGRPWARDHCKEGRHRFKMFDNVVTRTTLHHPLPFRT